MEYITIFLGPIIILFAPYGIMDSITSVNYLNYVTYVGCTTIIRIGIAYLMAKIITSYRLSIMEIDRDGRVYLTTLYKNGEIRLSIISLLIFGIPISELKVGNDIVDAYFTDLISIETKLLLYAIDLVRTVILIFLIRRLVVRNVLSESL